MKTVIINNTLYKVKEKDAKKYYKISGVTADIQLQKFIDFIRANYKPKFDIDIIVRDD